MSATDRLSQPITDPRGLPARDVARLNAAYGGGHFESRRRYKVPARYAALAALAYEWRLGYAESGGIGARASKAAMRANSALKEGPLDDVEQRFTAPASNDARTF